YIIVGLGNPGREYKYTRHNTGFEVIDKLAYDYNININKSRFNGISGEGIIEGEKVMLLKPLTYMNLSGNCVAQAVNFYKLPLDKLIVCCDDINLPVGSVRIRRQGSDGGQKGLRNIIERLGSENFTRVRVGVGEKPLRMDLKDWVLSHFMSEEGEDIIKGITDAGDSVKMILKGDINGAMGLYNKKVRVKENV
ncbi:MAG: aminoacyl-tRNA hydrolase, partial [Clostridiales bacterium]|nr:aminoacyl-tRNA hydrolase [Clostridiales bacterium]